MSRIVFPEVTDRKYYDNRWQGHEFFVQLGFNIEDYHSTLFKTETSETAKKFQTKDHYDDFVFCNGGWLYSCTTILISTEKKQLCIGGPLDGQWKSQTQAPEYTVFNNTDRSFEDHKTVLLYTEFLKTCIKQGNKR